jgi:hypothetical protein
MIGLSGTQRPKPTAGMDFYLALKETKYYHRYNSVQGDLVNSFGAPEVIQGQWLGYGHSDEGNARYAIWDNLLSGSHLVAYYKLMLGKSPNQDMAIATHDLRLRRYYKYVGEEMAQVTKGLGKLLLNYDMDYDPIAVYHSQPSNNLMIGKSSFSTMDATYAIKRILEDGGFRFKMLDSREVIKGVLAKEKIKVLILPHIFCLGDKELAQLKQFVRQGGVVIADQKIATHNAHGKPRKFGKHTANSKLFGFYRGSSYSPTLSAEKLRGTSAAGTATAKYDALQLSAAQQGLKMLTAKPWLKSQKGVPAVIVNRLGKGYAVYMNLDFRNYASSAAAGVGGEVTVEKQGTASYTKSCVDIWQKVLLDCAKFHPQAKLLYKKQQLPNTRTYYFSQGKIKLVAFLHKKGLYTIKPQDYLTVTYELPQKAHIYELRSTKKYYGQTQTIKDVNKPCIASVFAMLPYKVQGVALKLNSQPKPGKVLTVRGQVKTHNQITPGRHVVRVEALAPNGRIFEGFCRNIMAPKGQFKLELPLALNEQKGQWQLVARDVISGKTATINFKL